MLLLAGKKPEAFIGTTLLRLRQKIGKAIINKECKTKFTTYI
jgi:hypothetical protein